jgi:hypothetical protein
MKKVLFGLLLLSSVSVFAQRDDEDEKAFHIGFGGNVSLPLGDLKQGTTYGVGFEVQPSLMFNENIEGFAQLGVDVFKAKTEVGYGDDGNNLLHIPLLVGGRFKTNGFFAGAGVGYGLWKSSGESSNGFMYSPQIGYDAGKIEIAAHYSSTKVTGGSLSYFGIKLFRKL